MRRSIRNRSSRRRVKKDFELPLTSMMDMLVILLVFLLKSYSTSAVAFTTSANMTLPASSTPDMPTEGTNLIVDPAHFENTPDGKTVLVPSSLMIEGEKVAEFQPTIEDTTTVKLGVNNLKQVIKANYDLDTHMLGDGGRRILPLFDALQKEREKFEYVRSKQVVKEVEVDTKTGKPIIDPATGQPKVSDKPKEFHGILIIHADKGIEYSVLRKVMYTAAAAEFKTFKLVTSKKEEASPPPASPKGT